MDDDDDHSEGSFGGSSQNDSCAGSSMSASAKNAAASKRASRSSNITVHEDNAGTEVVETNAQKTKRAPRCLREYSAIVSDTLKTKGRTTYAEVADDIISKLSGNESETATSLSESEEKNIRRRVYDAINVLEAMKIVRKHKKEIKWEGLPDRSTVDLEGMKAECGTLMNTIRRKTAYLQDLQQQVENLQTLMLRNEQLLKDGNTRSERFSLPFILAQTSRDATVEVEISEDMHMVYFDFNSSPFFLHDDTYVIKLLLGRQQSERANVS